jgi:hypothetical protein
MKYIKKFETFDFSQTIPVTTKNFLTNYYSCDECNSLWKEYNKHSNICKFCTSFEIEELPKDEWYEVAKARLHPDEIKNLENIRKESESEIVDLLNFDDV